MALPVMIVLLALLLWTMIPDHEPEREPSQSQRDQ